MHPLKLSRFTLRFFLPLSSRHALSVSLVLWLLTCSSLYLFLCSLVFRSLRTNSGRKSPRASGRPVSQRYVITRIGTLSRVLSSSPLFADDLSNLLEITVTMLCLIALCMTQQFRLRTKSPRSSSLSARTPCLCACAHSLFFLLGVALFVSVAGLRASSMNDQTS